MLVQRVSRPENDPGPVQLQPVLLPLTRSLDNVLHLLLPLRAQNHNGKTALSLVRQGNLLDQGYALLAPTQYEGVPGLHHLPRGDQLDLKRGNVHRRGHMP